MKKVDLNPSEWTSEKPKPMSVWAQMREASRTYEPPPVSIGLVLKITVIMTVLYCARHGWGWMVGQ